MPIKEQTLRLIDELKATRTSYGMGNDGNEYKIITQGVSLQISQRQIWLWDQKGV